MNKKFKWEFEKIDINSSRIKVIGGWIVVFYTTLDIVEGGDVLEAPVFVPDPNHEWEIEKCT